MKLFLLTIAVATALKATLNQNATSTVSDSIHGDFWAKHADCGHASSRHGLWGEKVAGRVKGDPQSWNDLDNSRRESRIVFLLTVDEYNFLGRTGIGNVGHYPTVGACLGKKYLTQHNVPIPSNLRETYDGMIVDGTGVHHAAKKVGYPTELAFGVGHCSLVEDGVSGCGTFTHTTEDAMAPMGKGDIYLEPSHRYGRKSAAGLPICDCKPVKVGHGIMAMDWDNFGRCCFPHFEYWHDKTQLEKEQDLAIYGYQKLEWNYDVVESNCYNTCGDVPLWCNGGHRNYEDCMIEPCGWWCKERPPEAQARIDKLAALTSSYFR